MIGDMFIGDTRSNALAIFYFMMLIGGLVLFIYFFLLFCTRFIWSFKNLLCRGLGYITASSVTAATGSWNWGLRVTPILSLISVVLIIFFMKEPARGESEGSRLVSTSWKKDILYLLKKYPLSFWSSLKNYKFTKTPHQLFSKSFMYSTTASIALIFVIGAVGVWGPQFVVLSRKVLEDDSHTFDEYA